MVVSLGGDPVPSLDNALDTFMVVGPVLVIELMSFLFLPYHLIVRDRPFPTGNRPLPTGGP